MLSVSGLAAPAGTWYTTCTPITAIFDGLGSTSLATKSNGQELTGSRTLYYPYGQVRWSDGTLPTDYTFTGQKDAGLGLMDYRARFYDPYIARFVSADSIVPEPGNPQSLNRYSYVLGNPLNLVDPSGHQDEPPDNYPPGWEFWTFWDWVKYFAWDDNTFRRMIFLTRAEYRQGLYNRFPESKHDALDQAFHWADVLGQGMSLAMLTAPMPSGDVQLLSDIDWAADAAWARTRAQELQQLLGKSEGWTTMAAATAYSEDGTRHLLIGSSEGDYLRPSVRDALLPEEVLVGGSRHLHAEENIVNYAMANDLQVAFVEATRDTGICPRCEFYFLEAGGVPGFTVSGNEYLPTVLRTQR
jgi:RHS repeat-associated protein